MSSRIILKKTDTIGKIPLVTDLEYGELAINYADGKVYYKDAANAIRQTALDSAEIREFIQGADLDLGTNKILFSNVYSNFADLPSASDYHGMFAHVHATGKAYYAHAGAWLEIANKSELDAEEAARIAGDSAEEAARIAADTALDTSLRSAFAAADTSLNDTLRAYIDAADSDLQASLQSYADQAEADAISTANAHTNTRHDSAISYIDQEIANLGGVSSNGIDSAINALKDGAPTDLNTLDKLAQAIGDDAVFASTINASVNLKVDSAGAISAVANAGYATQTYVVNRVDSAVAQLVDAAPETLNTLNELAQALGDNDSFSADVLQQLGTKKDSAGVVALINSIVDSAYVAEHHKVIDGGLFDSYDVLELVDSNYVAIRSGGLDSTGVTNLIDSAYIQSRQSSGGGTPSFAAVAQSIIPATDITYDLGSPTHQWRDVYVGPGSLYVNGQKVIEDNSGTITFSADPGQSMAVATTGTSGAYTVTSEAGINLTTTGGNQADIALTPAAGGNIEINGNIQFSASASIVSAGVGDITFGDNIDMSLNRITNVSSPQLSSDVATKGYVDANGGGGAAGTDSATVQGMIDTSIAALDITDSAPVQAMIDTSIAALVDGAPTALDTLNELATALSNDSDALTALTTTVDSKLNAAAVTSLIDSAYIQAREASVDVTGVVDSAYVQARQSTTNVNVNLTDFEFIADSGATVFSGVDANGVTLNYASDNLLVHLNGILMKDGVDYTANDGSTITLASPADVADILTIHSFSNAAKVAEATTATTAVPNQVYIVDTTSTAVTVTLPANPKFGDQVKVIDGVGNAETNNITIARNGSNLLGSGNDFTVDINRASIEFVYYNTIQGWIISSST